MRETVGGDSMSGFVIFRLNAPDCSHDTIDVFLIEDVVLVLKADARLECIIVVINVVLVNALFLSRLVHDGFGNGFHLSGRD